MQEKQFDQLNTLEADNLIYGYQNSRKSIFEVGEVDHLFLKKGELVCLLGPNGAGKSTLIRTLIGVQKALKGEVFIKEENITHLSKKKLAKLVSVVLTDKLTDSLLNVYDTVSMGRYPYVGWQGKLSEHDHQIVCQAIEDVDMWDFKERTLSTLSDGEKQKVMLARALAQDTPIIVLDEPTAHLDTINRIELMRLLRNTSMKNGKSILISTHEIELALAAADRIWLMDFQKGVICGESEELVINGALENIFSKEGIEFDADHGVFKFISDQKSEISLRLKISEKAPEYLETLAVDQRKTAEKEVRLRLAWATKILEREGIVFVKEPKFIAEYFIGLDTDGKELHQWHIYQNHRLIQKAPIGAYNLWKSLLDQ